jgi:SAM-dependent methyltransferase/uncharacterized protein YbaR (Trm112 family)
MNEWLMQHLACPRDKKGLEREASRLICSEGHSYPVVDEIPVMLIEEAESTHGYIGETLDAVKKYEATGELPDGDAQPLNGDVDPFVQAEIPYTSGNLYFSVQHKLERYPIPETRLWPGKGERLLDIGCNWGRWSIAAAKKGYKPVGFDPSLRAVLAARRVARQLGTAADFIVGDARFLPFRDDSFDVVFSYGVYQHLSKDNVRTSLDEVHRVLKRNGKTLFQMPNKYGIRQYQQHRRRGFTEGEGFDVRYWSPGELIETFRDKIGATRMFTDCYFGLGIQSSDADMLPLKFKLIVQTSEILRKVSRAFPPLIKLADSVYLESINKKSSPH